MKAYNVAMSPSTTTSSSVKSSTTMEDRDSCYFPGCRKDANCDCEICLASINATLDLIQFSIHNKSSLTKLSDSRPNVERTPVSFDPSVISTPRSSSCPKIESPVLKSTARAGLNVKKEKRKKPVGGFGGGFVKLVMGLGLLFLVEIGFSRVLRPVISIDIVREIGYRSWVVKDLSGRLRLLQNELKGFVGNNRKVANCSNLESIWEINDEDGLLLNSQCTLYKSSMEEVIVWGWPLQTAGLLKSGFSSRSLTVLAGRVTEWSEGNIGYSIRKANTSWVIRKWGSSVVQLDPNTWILEYRRSSIMDNSRLFASVVELFKYRMSRMVKRMNQVSLLSAFEEQYSELFTAKEHIKAPT